MDKLKTQSTSLGYIAQFSLHTAAGDQMFLHDGHTCTTMLQNSNGKQNKIHPELTVSNF